jgi:hypothetical protein
MAAPEPFDEFDRLLANEDHTEKYVALGLAMEELLEKIRMKGFEAEKQSLSRLLELSEARAQLLELGAQRLLDTRKQTVEQAFLRDPHNLVQPFRAVLKENRDEVERIVRSSMAAKAPSRLSAATKFLIGMFMSLGALAAALIVLHRLGILRLTELLWSAGYPP